MRKMKLGLAILGLAALAWPGWGQTAGNFLVVARDGDAARQVTSGSTVEFQGEVGVAKTVTVEITYAGSLRAEFGAASLTGARDFGYAAPVSLPVVLTPGQTLVLQLRFEPMTSARTLAQLGVTVRELPPDGSGLQPGGFGLILLGLSGTAPEVKYAYALSTDGNVLPVSGGGIIRIVKAPVGQPTLTTVLVVNQGTAAAKVEAVKLEGDAELDLVQLPLLPLELGAGQSMQFRVRYQPKALAVHHAALTMTAQAASVTVQVEGVAQGPKWVYEVRPSLVSDAGTVVEPDGVLTLAETEIGKKSTVWLRVKNEGNDEGVVPAVAVSGVGFGLIDPPLAQTVVKVGAELWFGVNHSGVQAGRNTGRLRVGSDTFVLSVMVVGEMLEYSYTAGGTTELQPGGLVVLPATAVGQVTAAMFTLENKGNRAASIASIALSGVGKSYSLASVPDLPLALEADGKASFTIRFAPAAPGINTDVLTVGNAFFNLTGSAQALPELPGYRWEGPAGEVSPLAQPAIGLTLDEPYPVSLRGTLTMTVDSASFGADPSVQFSTGGRVANFTVPAGATRALFANGGTSIRMQTGTAAGTMVLTPSFVTESGIDRTPASPAVLSMTVPAAAPVLLAARTEVTATGLNFVITGYSTPRNLTKLDVTVTRKNGKSETFSFDVASGATLWFNSAASLSFGGLFSASAPFTIVGSVDDRAKLFQELDTVTVTAANDRGTSKALTVPAG